MGLIYGRWSREELEAKKESVFEPFKVGSLWYRVKELVVGPTGANYQAEEIEEPPPRLESVPIEQPDLQPVPSEKQPLESVPAKKTQSLPPIRAWARKKGILPQTPNGPTYLSREVREAYQQEFGLEALQTMLKRESLDARRVYAKEGAYPEQGLYKRPSAKDQQEVDPEQLQELYQGIPGRLSEARVAARDQDLNLKRVEKRKQAKATGVELLQAVIKERKQAMKKRTSPDEP